MFKGVFRQFNGCPCIDARANPIPGGAGPPPAGAVPPQGAPGFPGGPPGPAPFQPAPLQPSQLQSAMSLLRFSRAASSPSKPE